MLCEQLFLTKEAKKIPTVFLSGVKYKIKKDNFFFTSAI